MRRVVVTGMGLVTPLGHRRRARLAPADRRRIGHPRDPVLRRLRPAVARSPAQVPRGDRESGLFNADDWVPPKDQRRMDEFIVFAHGRGRAGGRGFRLEARQTRKSASAPA